MPLAARQTPAISGAAYSAGYAIGGKLTFDFRLPGPLSGFVTGVKIIDRAKQGATIDLVLFNDPDFTASNDREAFAPVSGELAASAVGFGRVSTWSTFDANALGQSVTSWPPFTTPDGKLYGQLVSQGTPTFVTSGDITVILEIMPDV